MLEISVLKKYEKKRKILASEVNDKALKKTDIKELLKKITDAEHALNAQVTGKSAKILMELYQKAIEYYSALENKCFEDFLNRMTNLFKREEIQKALANPDEEEKLEEPPQNEEQSFSEKTNTTDKKPNTPPGHSEGEGEMGEESEAKTSINAED
jgi:Mg-chelatase subunit ChlI